MVWVPMARADVVSVATPPVMGPVPRIVAPSRNVMVPVAVVGTVAVKVTGWLSAAGFSDEVSVTLGVAIATVTVVAGEVAALVVAVSATEAVMGLEPTERLGTVRVATPLTTGAVPSDVEPLLKVTG